MALFEEVCHEGWVIVCHSPSGFLVMYKLRATVPVPCLFAPILFAVVVMNSASETESRHPK